MVVDEAAPADVLVIGAGAIGLTVAWRLGLSGRRVTLVDPSPGRGAIWAAAGMLAPASEAHFGDEAMVPLLAAAAEAWIGFAALLEERSGTEFGYRTTGTLLVAHDAGDRSELNRVIALQRALGLEALSLGRSEIEELEPALAPNVRSGVLIPGDHQVDTRALVTVLLAEIDRLGASVLRQHAVEVRPGATQRVVLADSTVVAADRLVVCPGAHLGQIRGLEGFSLPVIRPVKGHVLRLGGPSVLSRTVRATVRGRSIYLVPRSSGELVVGASVEERGFDQRVQAGEVHRLLDDARRIVPAVDELELRDLAVGLRPGSPDNAPTIEAFDDNRIVVATGHHRNGVLLAPLTAEIVASLLSDATPAALELVEQSHADRRDVPWS